VTIAARHEGFEADTVIDRSARPWDHVDGLVMGEALFRDDFATLVDGKLVCKA
jgi:hypothetical protein